MNILNRVTRRMLGKNPTRTWATIIGIMLSMALTVAVLEGAYSGLRFMENVEGATEGFYQGYYHGLTAEEAKRAVEQRAVKAAAVWQLVGYAALDNADRPLLAVDALGDNPDGILSVRLAAGRMPENDAELLLPLDWFSEPDLTRAEIEEKAAAAVGGTLTLSLGMRKAENGEPLTERYEYRFPVNNGGETLIDLTERTYTVVGVYCGFDRFIEGSNWCFRALTAGEGTGEYRVFFTLHLPALYRQFARTQTVSQNLIAHSSILRYHGVSDNVLLVALYGIAGILVALVALGSISLIYNSFSISVSERTRQFGILKSVGATKKQIRAMVRHEAFLLAGVGIVLGVGLGLAGIGVTLWAISPIISRMMTSESVLTAVQMRLIVSPAMLLIAAAVCLVTTLISARIPAMRAARLSPIEAIRQSADVKIRPREVKTSPLTQKLFGFDGMMASKSFKRNRKRYRATVLSLFISIVLFISASSLTSYLCDAINGVAGDSTAADILVYCSVPDGDPNALLEKLKRADGVTDGRFLLSLWTPITFDAKDLTDDYKQVAGLEKDDAEEVLQLTFGFVGDETFRSIVKDCGQNPDDYFSGAPVGAIVNENTAYVNIDGKNVYKSFRMVRDEAFPIRVTATDEREIDADGMVILVRDGILPNDALRLLGIGAGQIGLYPEEDYAKLGRPDENGHSPLGDALLAYEQTGVFDVSIIDREKLVIVPETDYYSAYELTLIGPCSAKGIVASHNAVLYPYSRMREVVDEQTAEKLLWYATYLFETENHTAAAEALYAIAEENQMRAFSLQDLTESLEIERLLVTVVNIFAYGFIILISLIAAANVFNTISTNVLLRRREFAMLKSIGLGEKGFRKMLNYECVIYGLKGLLWGLPAAALTSFLIWKVMSDGFSQPFYIPWHSIVIAVGSVFLVVFATMLYARHKLKRDNPIDALKNENL